MMWAFIFFILCLLFAFRSSARRVLAEDEQQRQIEAYKRKYESWEVVGKTNDGRQVVRINGELIIMDADRISQNTILLTKQRIREC